MTRSSPAMPKIGAQITVTHETTPNLRFSYIARMWPTLGDVPLPQTRFPIAPTGAAGAFAPQWKITPGDRWLRGSKGPRCADRRGSIIGKVPKIRDFRHSFQAPPGATTAQPVARRMRAQKPCRASTPRAVRPQKCGVTIPIALEQVLRPPIFLLSPLISVSPKPCPRARINNKANLDLLGVTLQSACKHREFKKFQWNDDHAVEFRLKI